MKTSLPFYDLFYTFLSNIYSIEYLHTMKISIPDVRLSLVYMYYKLLKNFYLIKLILMLINVNVKVRK